MMRIIMAALAAATFTFCATEADARQHHHARHQVAHQAPHQAGHRQAHRPRRAHQAPRQAAQAAPFNWYDHQGSGLFGSYPASDRQQAARQAGGERVAVQSLPHPAGCPSVKFCGCGVALKVFGHVNGDARPLWLAANWVRQFAPASPAPGMVAARSGHVFYIEQVLGNGRVIAYDPNGGRGGTWRHERSLAGFHVLDPHRPRHG